MSQAITPVKPTILVVPLDWGLGHATRCVPVIRALLQQNCSVILAGEDKTKNLLQKEFPQLIFLPLQGYRITYAKNRKGLLPALMMQLPKILAAIRKEGDWLRRMVDAYGIQGVISDNRYGLYHPGIPTVLITHQLLIKTSLGNRLDAWLQQIHYRWISRFSECWVPDQAEAPGLAGVLSHPSKLPPVPTRYLGPLSRFRFLPGTREKHLLVLLSGPEPQRSLLEARIADQLQGFSPSVVLVRGLPGGAEHSLQLPSTVRVYDHLPAVELEKAFQEASVVISRSGYSTVMDLCRLKKKSILIPTPGQPEQEYLARHLMKEQVALCLPQEKFRLEPALDLAHSFAYRFPEEECGALEKTLKAFLERVKNMAKPKLTEPHEE